MAILLLNSQVFKKFYLSFFFNAQELQALSKISLSCPDIDHKIRFIHLCLS